MIETQSVKAKEIKKELLRNEDLYSATRGNLKENLLMVALKNDRDIDVISLLLSFGINPNDKNKQKQTSLMYACKYSSKIEVVKKVLNKSAWFDFSKRRKILLKDKNGLNSFEFAISNPNLKIKEEIINLLDKYTKCEVDVKGEKSVETKSTAKVEKNVETFESEKINLQENESSDKIEKIIEKSEVKEIIEKIESNMENSVLVIPLKKEIAVDIDLNKKDENGMTKLMIASKNSDIETVKKLLSLEANVDANDNDGMTALMYATQYQSNIEIINLLLENNANFRKKNNNGMTALMIAVKYNQNAEIIKLLLKDRQSFEIDVQKAFIQSIISNASLQILQLFLNRGISVDMTLEDKTPLMYARMYSKTEIENWLLSNGAKK